jgi:hypothetical protein
LAEKRLSLTSTGQIRYGLKTPYRDGTTHIIFHPLDFITKLAALIPKPRVNLSRFHGVFVGVPHHSNSKHRGLITPSRRGKGRKSMSSDDQIDQSPAERRASMTVRRPPVRSG